MSSPVVPYRLPAALLLASLSVASANGLQWVPVGPPVGPPGILSIAAMATAEPNGPSLSPSILFVGGAQGGVWRSDDAGKTWTSLGSLPSSNLTALAVQQYELPLGAPIAQFVNTLYAGTPAAGVFRLDSGSATWIPINSGLSSLAVSSLLPLSQSAPEFVTILAGTGSGLFKSTDGGTTWSPRTAGLPSGFDGQVLSLAAFGSMVYAGLNGGLFQSADAGETWTPLPLSSTFKISVTTVTVDPLVPSRLFVAGAASLPCYPLCLAPTFSIALRSLDGGASWLTIEELSGNFVRAIAATPNLPARVFAAAGQGVFESDNGGAAWTPANDGLIARSVSTLVIDGRLPSFLYAGTDQGAFSAPLGQTAVSCVAGGQTLCLNGSRFSATVAWSFGGGNSGLGQAFPLTDNTGAFWFFDPTNLEVVVKVLDGRSVNGEFWVFVASLTDAGFTLTVTDTLTGATKTYVNPQGQLASFADTSAF
jgi:photosystem II stability/assembly factor-like uncharacterized protein